MTRRCPTAGDDLRNADADRLLDIRVELLAITWQEFVDQRDATVLIHLRAGDMLQRQAQRIARRRVRRTREGDDEWSAELDRIVLDAYTNGRLVSEIARKVDRPTPLTGERLGILGFPNGLWPKWDAIARNRRDALLDAGVELPHAARILRRSPWDIALSLLTAEEFGSIGQDLEPEDQSVGHDN